MDSTGCRNGGRQIAWESATRPADKPLITIITSTFNAERDLHWTGDSIRRQSYRYVQWIIADGASTDDTLSVVERYSDIIDIWFSEPDEGIYDAWNKALRYAKGEWIQFIGAGDELAEPDTLEKIAPVLEKAYLEHELVYGNLMYLSEIERQPLEYVGEPWTAMEGKWSLFRPKLPVHPAIFHHKSLFLDDKPFDVRFKIASDCHLLMKSIKTKEPHYCDILIDRMPLGGVSGKFTSSLQIFYENRQISKELGYGIPLRHQFFEFFILSAKLLVKTIVAKKVGSQIADMFRRVCGKKNRWSVK